MNRLSEYQKISSSPTRPTKGNRETPFDVAELYQGPLETGPDGAQGTTTALDEKLRQAYFWITNQAIISPFYDIEFQTAPPPTFTLGDSKTKLQLPTDQSYSSFVLLPLLTLATGRKCLLVGGPGRGKTASAILMGVLAGYQLGEIQQAIQHGQPQMTITDLLGNPLPSTLVNATEFDQVRISWRKWLGMRVKIIDEYNRIPTRTQSALLTVMGDNYAEMYDQIYHCPDSAWYLTANDEAGGGTYQVIEALRDRIDVVVRALHFNSRFLGELLQRMEDGYRPEEMVPPQVVFSAEELAQLKKEITALPLPVPLRRRIEFLASNLEFCEYAGDQLEYKTKDAVKVSGVELNLVQEAATGKDRLQELGRQTRNGLSVRALLTLMSYVKAMAYFRGNPEVQMDDIRQVLPFVLHDKLVQNPDAPFFEQGGNGVFRVDRIGWLRRLWDLSCQEYERLGLDRDDPVAELETAFTKGLEGVSEKETRARLAQIEQLLNKWAASRKLFGPMQDDILKLKYFHQRYSNYLRWLEWQGGIGR